jgi:hypothetical protein
VGCHEGLNFRPQEFLDQLCKTKVQSAASLRKGGLFMRHVATIVTTAITALILVGCGTNSVRVTPASADAKNFAGGVVPFVASGSTHPTWCIGTASGVCNGNVVSLAIIDSTGHAQCIPGASGTVTVLAGTAVRVVIPDGGEQLTHFGTAQLTCP